MTIEELQNLLCQASAAESHANYDVAEYREVTAPLQPCPKKEGATSDVQLRAESVRQAIPSRETLVGVCCQCEIHFTSRGEIETKNNGIVGEKRIAYYFANLSILFADIVGFRTIATEVPADEVVDFLNCVFGIYGDIIKRQSYEKSKTIGDFYSAISGVPMSLCEIAERITRAEIEMQNDSIVPHETRDVQQRDAIFNFHSGYHTGAAACGVIGKERFVWDADRDAVNRASRMESSGEPAKIHVSKEFARLLRSWQKMTKRADEFSPVDRGDVYIKGKGMMRTYYLEKR